MQGMEMLCLIAQAAVCAVMIILYNNRRCAQDLRGWRKKAEVVFKIRKNTVAAIILGLGLGSVLAWINMTYYDVALEYMMKLLLLFEFLIPVAYVDFKEKIIPNHLLAGMLACYVPFLIYEIVVEGLPLSGVLLRGMLGMLFGGGVLLLSSVLSRGGMGMGDVKLFGVLGLFLGWQDVFAVIFFSVLGVALAGVSLLLMKKADLKSSMPIGPFALLGLTVSMLLGI